MLVFNLMFEALANFMVIKRKTLDEFRLSELPMYPNATGGLSSLLREIALSAKRIQVEINRASALNNSDHETSMNASGEAVKNLDRFANDEILHVLKNSFSCAGAVSEEEESIQVFDNCQNNKSKYVVMFDPIDGSSNIDNCMTLGTIFGIYRRISAIGKPCEIQDFLQSGKSLAAAGYVIYGSSTMLVYATSRGVNGFTLDGSIGEFTLTHPGIKCPEYGNIYSINESKILHFPDLVVQHIKGMQEWNLHNPGSFTSRYVGSMVADLHRILLQGGIFLYPQTKDFTSGKLRLMYECNPFAYIFETAGGLASCGSRSIINIKPESIHQRSPLYIGSKRMVQTLTRINLNSFCTQ